MKDLGSFDELSQRETVPSPEAVIVNNSVTATEKISDLWAKNEMLKKIKGNLILQLLTIRNAIGGNVYLTLTNVSQKIINYNDSFIKKIPTISEVISIKSILTKTRSILSRR